MKNPKKDNRIFGIVCKKCGDCLYSLYRHDYKLCKCGAVGIDGGQEDYVRVIGSPEDRLWIYKKPDKED
jgi:threonine dehydrogenase-like Zn-dependent dehydrogenase